MLPKLIENLVHFSAENRKKFSYLTQLHLKFIRFKPNPIVFGYNVILRNSSGYITFQTSSTKHSIHFEEKENYLS